MFSSEPEERGDKIVSSNKKGLIIVGISIALIIIAIIIIVIVVTSRKNKDESKTENQETQEDDSELEVYKKYEKLEKLGQGAIGVVYKGRDRVTKEIVAIKEIPIIEAEGFDIKKETEKEIKFMKIFSNYTNSIKIYDTYEQNNTIFIVMDLCDGDLSKFLKKTKNGFTVYEIKIIMKQFNTIYKELRKRDMIHNDVKIENILVKFKEDSKAFDIKLSDYGLAKLISSTKNLTDNEWGIEPFTDENKTIVYFVEKSDLLVIGVDVYRMLFKEPAKTFEEFLMTIDSSVEDEDLKDLLKKLFVEDPAERIGWDDYFNHKFFDIETFDFDKVENIIKN
jgi:serine/threonine protein kinase